MNEIYPVQFVVTARPTGSDFGLHVDLTPTGAVKVQTKSNHARLAHSRITLSGAKGLKISFFAALRMTMLVGPIVKCMNVMWSDLIS
jgi:hypothetical protein